MLESRSFRSEDVRSSILNCICPECGGAIELSSNQFRCVGTCGKDWRAIWDGTQSSGAQVRHADSSYSKKINAYQNPIGKGTHVAQRSSEDS